MRPTLEVTTVIGCPLACVYCPQKLLLSRYPSTAGRELDLEGFRQILSTVPDYVRIDFSGMAEPWTARDTTLMFLHAMNQGHPVAVYTTLFGMDDKDVAALVDRIDSFTAQNPLCLHLPDDEGRVRGFRPSDGYREHLRSVLAAMNAVVEAKGNDGGLQMMTMSSSGRLHPSIAGLLPSGLGPFGAISRAGTVDEELAPRVMHEAPVVCHSSPHYDHNTVLPNGDVILCCMDYGCRHVLGNLFADTYQSLFYSAEMRRLTRSNDRTGLDDTSICKSCTNATEIVA
ncbi:MAG: SPASM domain-containing protein [Coriobacteriia bacterium]|nr:SPASM domain-containing protein [Coriobacteriia bacterium]